jgi:hypothetical protein
MKLLVWLIMIYNRRWQKQLDVMVSRFDETDTKNKLATKYEPMVGVPTKKEIMEAINSQPTHLSNKFKSRPKKKYYRKEVNSDGSSSN